ncbi:diacylglycerol/lipid kinase family protein [Bariatricus sp. HCP28S3_C2]|uniref:diacylglycerol/lipid kinase family protein n=1 Tax=Bariatricus sp. HCP28S3_C2 TaxID=3438898 RepID=UPI003F8A2B59
MKRGANYMLHFIVNPCARSGLGKIVWEKIEQKLADEQVAYQMYFTQYKCHATKIAQEITSDGHQHTLVVLGGDGSINEVINGICYLDKTTLGYIPLGSGNDFARGLQIPSDPEKALEIVLHSPHKRTLNLGVLNFHYQSHRFAVSSGIGYDAAICHQINRSRIKRILNRINLGQLGYVALSVGTLFRWHPIKMKLLIDGTKTLHFQKVYFAAAMNLPFEGGGCKFCPTAKPDDNFLDLIVIADVPKVAALTILPTVFSGKHTHMKGVHIYRFKHANVKVDVPLVLHSDGEPFPAESELEWMLESDSLQILVP